eukprot:TRINITY_DN38851_c0_g1_i1.p1 TRINITY_DN38851_c0_g1~~TRINITY_DN38851_c0_g1_i1.p1  ORF type:complete len:370 (+),score=86.42 TRINITY_DN38851_c0_g1_i1:26-1111(+)
MVVVVMFMLYPWLMREVSLMLSCTDPICMAEGVCHRYLEADPSVDCDLPPYSMYRILSFCALVVYGVGIPALAFFQIWRRRDELQTKAVVSTLGFLYSGYRRRWYFWECVTLLRKMLLVFIVVFLVRYPSYQLYAAMWLMTTFCLINVLVRPYKDSNLWYMENVSLLSVVVTYNLGLLHLADPSSQRRMAVGIAAFSLNVVVLVVFVVRIVAQVREEVRLRTRDVLGEEEVSCSTIVKYIKKKYNELKPSFLKSYQEVREDSRLAELKRFWFNISAGQRQTTMRNKVAAGKIVLLTPAATMGYWMQKYEKRSDRFEVISSWVQNQDNSTQLPHRPLACDEKPPLWSPLTSPDDNLLDAVGD